MTHEFPAADDGRFRWSVYALLLTTSMAGLFGRLVAVEASTGESPMLSANDRSRWAAVRALVERNAFGIDGVINERHPRTGRRWFDSIDKVQHLGRDGRLHSYSSKPPLFTVMVAGEYWLLRAVTGAEMGEEPFFVIRSLLAVTNLLPMLALLLMLVALVERYGTTDWGRVFVVATGAWGTLLLPMGVTLNNHLPAAVTGMGAVLLADSLWQRRRKGMVPHFFVGLLAALTAANELPALSLLAALGGLMAVRDLRATLLGFLPGAGLVVAAFFAVNYVAHDSWRPPYMHRSDGPVLARLDPPPAPPAEGPVPAATTRRLLSAGLELKTPLTFQASATAGRWVLRGTGGARRYAVIAGEDEWVVHAWDNWYEYPGSYWMGGQRGVDRGEPSRLVYAFHATLGHHGWFSLTPVWFLSVWGAAMVLRRPHHPLWFLAMLAAVLSVVCLTFYLGRPLADRNYGGVSCGFRWLFWLIPLWLACLVPAADRVAGGGRRARAIALALLALSCFSATASGLRPWSHPWLYVLGEWLA